MEYKDKGVLFLGVFAMSKDKEIRTFADEYGISYPVGRENGIAETLGVKGIPETVFINKKGVLVKHHYNVVSYDELKAEINSMLE